MNRTQEQVMAKLKLEFTPGCEFCKDSKGSYCESSIGCNWQSTVFGKHLGLASWDGFKQDDAKLERVASKLADKIDAIEVSKRLEGLML